MLSERGIDTLLSKLDFKGLKLLIISHSKRFVYIKPGKTAGTSVELAFSPFCASGDTVTRLRLLDERMRPECEVKIKSPTFQNRKTDEIITLNNHSSYGNALRAFGEKIVDYDVMCTERSPWEKAISSYYWKGNGKKDMSDAKRFNNFVRGNRSPENFWFYALYNVPAVDFVIRQECIQTDYAKFLAHFGANIEDFPLVRAAKAGNRPKEATLTRMYSVEETREHIKTQFADQLAFIPYKFGEKDTPDCVLNKERRNVRVRFLEEHDCGPEHWQEVLD